MPIDSQYLWLTYEGPGNLFPLNGIICSLSFGEDIKLDLVNDGCDSHCACVIVVLGKEYPDCHVPHISNRCLVRGQILF